MAAYNSNVDNTLFLSTKRYAVVTGANKGIGLEICRQLASNGVTVILTARDESRGIQAVENLKKQDKSLSDLLEFHQLDVADPLSVVSMADFLKSKFGKLDILVNNAAVLGSQITNFDAYVASFSKEPIEHTNFSEIATDNYDLSKQCLETNYFGPKSLIDAVLPLLQMSDAGRIVNVSSLIGWLKNIPSESVRGILGDVENLQEEKIDELVNEFLEDMKKGELASKGWPPYFPPYSISKAAVNAYTRIMARKYPDVDINCVCPGFVKTDINYNSGILSVEEGAKSAVRLALLPKGEASGIFFSREEASPF